MKRLELTLPIALLDDLGILSARFFRNNRAVEVLQSFAVRPDLTALVVRVHRRGPFKDVATVRREARSIANRYRVDRFDVLSMDEARGEYVAWIEWALPPLLRGKLGEEWGGVVPLEVTQTSDADARVVLLTTEDVLPRLRAFLDDLEAPYRIRSIRTAAGARWDPLAPLTRRQRDVLELALRMGYYGSPATAGLAEIAAKLGISRAAVSKHLRTAERKVLTAAVKPK